MLSKILAATLSIIGAFAATIGTQGCTVFFWDEPKMPKSMLEK